MNCCQPVDCDGFVRLLFTGMIKGFTLKDFVSLIVDKKLITQDGNSLSQPTIFITYLNRAKEVVESCKESSDEFGLAHHDWLIEYVDKLRADTDRRLLEIYKDWHLVSQKDVKPRGVCGGNFFSRSWLETKLWRRHNV